MTENEQMINQLRTKLSSSNNPNSISQLFEAELSNLEAQEEGSDKFVTGIENIR